MKIVIIFLSILLALAAGVIFCLVEVLKMLQETKILKLLQETIFLQELVPQEAYDGKYYPATVLTQLVYGSEEDKIITDFSMYESNGIVAFTFYNKENLKSYIKKTRCIELTEEEKMLSDDELNELFSYKPIVYKDAIVYATNEGEWTYKCK